MYIKQSVIILTSCLLFACASTEQEPSGSEPERLSSGSDCISQGSIRDYTVLDDANLIVTGAGRRKYHMVLARRAFGLRSSWQIGFRDRTGRICGGFGELIADDGFGPASFRIESIRQLDKLEEEELLIRFGKKEPEFVQPRQPEEVEGAEVEELD